MNLDDARHVLKNTARINEGGYVADCRDLVLNELDAAHRTLAEIDDLAFAVIAGEGADKTAAQAKLADLLTARVDKQLRAALGSACIETASCEEGDHSYSWPCTLASTGGA